MNVPVPHPTIARTYVFVARLSNKQRSVVNGYLELSSFQERTDAEKLQTVAKNQSAIKESSTLKKITKE